MDKINKNLIIPVVLAGGKGTRLWPISTDEKPKQFCDLIGNETLFQLTLKRINNIPLASNPIVICNQQHVNLVKEQSSQIGISLMATIIEPFGRNTAPAVTLAAIIVKDILASNDELENDPVLLILPADHAIEDLEAFNKSIKAAYEAASAGYIVCFGVTPKYPETGYGYIRFGNLLTKADQFSAAKTYAVDCFVEKPCLEIAKKYLDSGKYLWNSGMLMFRRSVFLEEMQHYSKDIYLSCKEILESSKLSEENFLQFSSEKFSLCRSESIDRAMMEYTSRAVVVCLDANWSDLGSFASLEKYLGFLNSKQTTL